MNDTLTLDRPIAKGTSRATAIPEAIIEVISDSGEGAQRCGQSLGAIAARMGNGIWTTEIIPAEIQPPARSVAGASGIRIRIGSERVTNGGDQTELVVAFNEQVLIGRVRPASSSPARRSCSRACGRATAIRPSWRPTSRLSLRLRRDGFDVHEVPLEERCKELVADPRKGKNMFVLGILCHLYGLDPTLAREQIARIFGKKDAKVIASNVALYDAGAGLGRCASRLQLPHPGAALEPGANRRQRQHRDRSRRHRLRDGHLRDVPDHARDLGIALPERGVREGRRPGAPGRGRDRRLRLRGRRVVRRQVRGDDHLGARLLAQAGGHRPRGDGGDSARRRQRPARRPEHGPADQGGAGRRARRDLRQPRRRAQGRDGARAASRTASTR
jgi:Pyruvate/2-oxoacid:ferredoxin oxidoreductase gamma subunit